MGTFILTLLGTGIGGLVAYSYKFPLTGRIISAVALAFIIIFYFGYQTYHQGRHSFYLSAMNAIIQTELPATDSSRIDNLSKIESRIDNGALKAIYLKKIETSYEDAKKYAEDLFTNCYWFLLIFAIVFGLTFLFQSHINKKVKEEKDKSKQGPTQKGSKT